MDFDESGHFLGLLLSDADEEESFRERMLDRAHLKDRSNCFNEKDLQHNQLASD